MGLENGTRYATTRVSPIMQRYKARASSNAAGSVGKAIYMRDSTAVFKVCLHSTRGRRVEKRLKVYIVFSRQKRKLRKARTVEERGEESLLRDPGSELTTGRERDVRAKVLNGME